MRRLSTSSQDFQTQFQSLTQYDPMFQTNVRSKVDEIIHQVRLEGDRALFQYACAFDGVDSAKHESVADLEVSKAMMAAAFDNLDPQLTAALQTSADRIRKYHEHQTSQDFKFADEYGNKLWQTTTPMQKVGIYVPGGKALYPSSVLMNAIPARVAGVAEIIMVTPLGQAGSISPILLAAAHLAGVDRIFTIGGAQAVAALAFGTDIIPKVDKIVGPGNTFVAMAKQAVFGHVGIDMIAGPSEIFIIADKTLPVDWAVYDLFSQAEHDEAAQSIIMSPDEQYLDALAIRIPQLLKAQSRSAIISASLEARGALIHTKSIAEAIQLSNQQAPEHLELAFVDAEHYADQITAAGSVFIGEYTTESFGDYCAGPNHVLPTSGAARFSSPLSVYDFQKRTSFTHCTPAGAQPLADLAGTMADAECLTAHACAARARLADQLS